MATTWDDFLADMSARGGTFNPNRGRVTFPAYSRGVPPAGTLSSALGPTSAEDFAANWSDLSAFERFQRQMAHIGGLLPASILEEFGQSTAGAGSDPSRITFTRDVDVVTPGIAQRMAGTGGLASIRIPETESAAALLASDPNAPTNEEAQAAVDAFNQQRDARLAAEAAARAAADATAAANAQAAQDERDYWQANADWRRREEQRIARERELSLIRQSMGLGPNLVTRTSTPTPTVTPSFDPFAPAFLDNQLTVSALPSRGGGSDPLPSYGPRTQRFGGQTPGRLGQRSSLLSNNMFQPAPITQRSWV